MPEGVQVAQFDSRLEHVTQTVPPLGFCVYPDLQVHVLLTFSLLSAVLHVVQPAATPPVQVKHAKLHYWQYLSTVFAN